MPPHMAAPFLVGMVAAAVSGLAAIWFLLGYLRRHTFTIFVVYRLVVATRAADRHRDRLPARHGHLTRAGRAGPAAPRPPARLLYFARLGGQNRGVDGATTLMRTLTLGDRGKEVSDVQKRLHALGLRARQRGPRRLSRTAQASSRCGPSSRSAACSSTACSGPTPGASWSRPATPSATACSTCACPSFRGDDVLALQVKLNLLGFNAGPERGIFDTRGRARRDRLPAQRRPAVRRHRRRRHAAQARRPAQGRVRPRGQEDPRPRRGLRGRDQPRRHGDRHRPRARRAGRRRGLAVGDAGRRT